MKITESIAKLEKILAEEGDIEVFDANTNSAQFIVEDTEEEGSSYPEDWNMPTKFVRVGFSSQ